MTTLNFSANTPISHILFKQCKLWVWDFDDTLIDTSVYYSSNMKPASILERTDKELDNEVPQWRYFRRLVEYLVSNGRYIGIASFGTYEIILAYMKRIMGFNQQFFTRKNIIAPDFKMRDLYRWNQPPNKNEYIYQLMRIYRVQDFKRVVLFDDNATNIADAIGIGIVGVQVPSQNGGDKPGGNMMFGPWIMANFDKNLKEKCGDELYRNRTYTGLVSKENYTGAAYNNKDIDFGTGARSRDGYFMEPYDMSLEVDDSSIYQGKTPAFGTGIGDRKINARPQFIWNATRMPRKITPQWSNGNYMNVPDLVDSTGYWDADTLGGATPSYWDKMQSVIKKKQEDENKDNRQITYPSGGGGSGWDARNSIEGFDGTSNGSGVGDGNVANCGCGMPPAWLMILLFILVVIISIVMVKM